MLGQVLKRADHAGLLDPARFVVLLGLIVAGLLLLFNLTLRHCSVRSRPAAGCWRALSATAGASRATADGATSRPTARGPCAKPTGQARAGRRATVERPRRRSCPPQAARHHRARRSGPRLSRRAERPLSGRVAHAGGGTASAPASRPACGRRAPSTGSRAPARVWQLPGYDAARPAPSRSAVGQRLDHARNIRIIEEKLRSFQIPASVVGTNTGPVVTQYEVKPDARVKLSRIEGLADDLAMALAARSIRIEAPIPGRDVVGIEIPNHTQRGRRLPRAATKTPAWPRRPASSRSRSAATCPARPTRSTWRACRTC